MSQLVQTQGSKAVLYDPNLIDSLKAEHRAILSIFKKVMECAGKKQYSILTQELNKFAKLFNTHLKTENVSLYMYLEHFSDQTEANKNSRTKSHDFRLEMNELTRGTASVINKYTHTPVTDATVPLFVKEFSDMGKSLIDRITREEQNLYPLYRQKSSLDLEEELRKATAEPEEVITYQRHQSDSPISKKNIAIIAGIVVISVLGAVAYINKPNSIEKAQAINTKKLSELKGSIESIVQETIEEEAQE